MGGPRARLWGHDSLPRVGGSQGFFLEQPCERTGSGVQGEAFWGSAEPKVLKEAVGSVGSGSQVQKSEELQ